MAESGTSGVKGAVRKRETGALDYANDLKGILFFFRYGAKPAGLSNGKFQALKPLCEKLVSKGKVFKPEVLDIFQ